MSEIEVGGGKDEKRKGWMQSLNPSVIGFLIPITVVLLYSLLGRFDDTTELWPNHDRALEGCFWFAGSAALAIGTIMYFASKSAAIGRRIMVTIFSALGSLVFVTIFSVRIAAIVNNRIDFPPQKTETFQALLRISRAYQTHGKGASSNIQTTPIWSNMNVTRSDYDFMRHHRRPGDNSNDPDEVSSKGYFCAKVTMQRSGEALRVLHAGSGTLPPGTVIICPNVPPPPPVRTQ